MRYLVKNHMKLMFRNAWSLAVLLLGPLLVIVTLSAAFTELMKSYEGVSEFTAGYRLEAASGYAEMLEAIRTEAAGNGILLQEYPDGDITDIIEKNDLAGFIDLASDSYVLYRHADHEVEGATLEYFLSCAMDEGINASLGAKTGDSVAFPSEALEHMPSVSATDYYGIIEIVYFCWCGIVCATGMLGSEKKYRIGCRFQCAGLSETGRYLSRLIPMTLMVGAGMLAEAVITAGLMDIHWGRPLISAGIILCMVLAANALGLMLYAISENLAITIIVQFMLVWVMGYLGGSFETYMFSATSDSLKRMSPLYHGNRALVELSCMGHSDYVGSAVCITLLIAAGCSAAAVFAGSMRRRGKA